MTINNVKYVQKAKKVKYYWKEGSISRHAIFFTIAGAYRKNYIVSKGQPTALRPPSAGDSSLSVALSSFCRSSIDPLCLVGSHRTIDQRLVRTPNPFANVLVLMAATIAGWSARLPMKKYMHHACSYPPADQPRGLWPVGLLLFLATGGQTGRSRGSS